MRVVSLSAAALLVAACTKPDAVHFDQLRAHGSRLAAGRLAISLCY